MDWQEFFYSWPIPDAELRKQVRAIIRKHYDCDAWRTKQEHLIPMVLMRESHMVNGWHYNIRRAEANRDSYHDMRPAIDALFMLKVEFERRSQQPPTNPKYDEVMARWNQLDSWEHAEDRGDDWYNSWMYTGDN